MEEEQPRNELAICIYFASLLVPVPSTHKKPLRSEVIRKKRAENVFEVIFYESIKAIKASAGSSSLKFSKNSTSPNTFCSPPEAFVRVVCFLCLLY